MCAEPWATMWSYSIPVVALFLIGYILYGLVTGLNNRYFFRKISLYGNEIEVFEHHNESFFDKYLNEVLYLFENAGTDVIVFEDIDRFDDVSVFEKLREINLLVNGKTNGRIIRFFYLLRDNIFATKDRTKFFDFIIPIVPVVDSSNSYDQLLDHFKKTGMLKDEGEEKGIDPHFLQGLSLYVDDMRILKNILNEFLIYHRRLYGIEASQTKLLAMIVYKNLFPKDFADSQLTTGFIYNLFAQKEKLISREIMEKQKQIESNKAQIEKLSTEHLASLDELDAVFFPWREETKINNSGGHRGEYRTQLSVVKEWKAGRQSIIFYESNPHYPTTLTKSLVDESLGKNKEYIARKETLTKRRNGRLVMLQHEIQTLSSGIADMKEAKLQKILTRENIDAYFAELKTTNDVEKVEDFESVKGNHYFPLLKYLVRNGYIDESYPDYMTYFYEHHISRTDKVFVRSVADKVAKGFTYELTNPKAVLSYLKLIDFDEEETLNFDLLRYLLAQKHPYTNHYRNRLVCQLKDDECFDFIFQFLEKCGESANLFVVKINNLWPEIWREMIASNEIPESMLHDYAVKTLYFSPSDDIKRMNDDGSLANYISQNPDFLRISQPQVDKISQGLIDLGVHFVSIDYEKSDKNLFDEVYKNSLYVINVANILLMLDKIYGINDDQSCKHKNYSLICSRADEHLKKYVEKNIQTYFDLMIANCGSQITDDEQVALSILNDNTITQEGKVQYIGFLKTKLDDIAKVKNQELWTHLLSGDVAINNATNILHYFVLSDKIDDTLCDFINRGTKPISFTKESIIKQCDEKKASKFFYAVVQCKNLSVEKYKMILEKFGLVFPRFVYPDISPVKMEILLSQKKIEMNKENLLFLREHYSKHPDLLKSFILSDSAKYADFIDKDTFKEEELLWILPEGSVDDAVKIKLLPFTKNPISVLNSSYSSALVGYLLKHNTKTDDLPVLAQKFNSYQDENVQSEIKHHCLVNLSKLIEKKTPFCFDLLTLLLTDTDNSISQDDKTTILANSLKGLASEQIKSSLETIGMDQLASIFDGSRPKISREASTEKLLEALEECGWVSSYKPDKTDEEFYQVFPKKGKS